MKRVSRTFFSVKHVWLAGCMAWGACLLPQVGYADGEIWHQETVNFLGTTLSRDRQPIGVVAPLKIAFRKREGQEFINISFASGPGNFSPLTQVAIQEGIKRAASAAGLNTNTWDIFFIFPLPGVTVYGESISAMVSLAVLAMANDVPLLIDRVVTGKITKEGDLGPVGGIPEKIQAAHKEHIQRVIIPEERFWEDSDWQTPFLMHISHAKTVWQAYRMLTGRNLPDKTFGDPQETKKANNQGDGREVLK